MGLSRAVHLHVESRAQGVDDGRTHAVQATGGRVRPATELASRVQFRHDEFHAGQLGLRLLVDRDATSVITHQDGSAGLQHHLDLGAMAPQRLVHGIVKNLPQAVHQPTAIVAADVHAGPLAYRVETLEDGQIPGRVGPRGLLRCHLLNAIALGRHFPGSARCRSEPVQLLVRGCRDPHRHVSPPANSLFGTRRNGE